MSGVPVATGVEAMQEVGIDVADRASEVLGAYAVRASDVVITMGWAPGTGAPAGTGAFRSCRRPSVVDVDVDADPVHRTIGCGAAGRSAAASA